MSDSAEDLRCEAERLQGLADALRREALEREVQQRASSSDGPGHTRRWGKMVIVAAPPLGSDTIGRALRSADVDAVEQRAHADGIKSAQQQQHERLSGGRRKVGDTTRAKVLAALPEARERMFSQYGHKVPKNTVEVEIARAVGVSVRTVQRWLVAGENIPT